MCTFIVSIRSLEPSGNYFILNSSYVIYRLISMIAVFRQKYVLMQIFQSGVKNQYVQPVLFPKELVKLDQFRLFLIEARVGFQPLTLLEAINMHIQYIYIYIGNFFFGQDIYIGNEHTVFLFVLLVLYMYVYIRTALIDIIQN